MILRIAIAVIIGTAVFFLAGPIHYYFRTAPQRAAFAEMARQSEEEIRRFANSPSFSNADNRAAMERIREREARSRQLLAEKQRLRTQTWLIALIAGPLSAGAAFLGLTLIARRRRTSRSATTPPVEPQ